MKMIAGVVTGLAVAASVAGLMGCEGDPSAPSRPRRQLTPLAPDDAAKENAEKRELEKPDRSLPTSGKEYPGQTKAAPAQEPSMLTACVNGHGLIHRRSVGEIPTNGTNALFGGRLISIGNYQYPGPLEPLPSNPGSVPLQGHAKVPYSDWAVDNSWGQVMVLKEYPHRDWGNSQTTYMAANVKHNPVYYSTIQGRLPVAPNDNTFQGNWGSTLLEVPAFYLQTAALPVMMALECPFGQVTTQRLGSDPNYFGWLPPGPVVPGPVAGVIRWDYPFLYAGAREVTTMPADKVILPTPGITPAPLDLPTGPTTQRRETQPGAPGLR